MAIAMMTGTITIPGIYHYCDQWCERCMFTTHCSFFQENIPSTGNEAGAASFYDNWTVQLEFARKYFSEILRKDNLHPDDVLLGNWVNEKTFPLPYGAAYKQQSLYRQSLYYGIRVHRWLSEELPLAELQQTILGKIEFVVGPAEEVLMQWQQIQDNLDLVLRHAPVIHTKLARALLSRVKNDRWQLQNGLPKDSDGSAKVAKILVSQSVNAMKGLYETLPSQQDFLLPLLSTLQKTGDEIMNEFPEADTFIRPGFDEIAPEEN